MFVRADFARKAKGSGSKGAESFEFEIFTTQGTNDAGHGNFARH